MPLEKILHMAKVLPDSEVRKLFGIVILNADEKRINPNGIEIRLGARVLFQSTDEEKEIKPGMFLKVLPGETVTIASYETFNFTREAIHKVYPGCDLMAFITPTTTMMREGIMQASTKVDSGWHGTLNWGLRNSSVKDFILGYGEPIFKLTILLLQEGETPETPYGERTNDRYQGTEGIARSTRMIPANIPKQQIVGSSIESLDPAKQLSEAGYPFNHISRELTQLHGQFDILSTKVDDSQERVLEKVEHLFSRKFLALAGGVVGCISIMYGIITFLQSHGITGTPLGWVCVTGGAGLLFVAYLLTRPSTHN